MSLSKKLWIATGCVVGFAVLLLAVFLILTIVNKNYIMKDLRHNLVVTAEQVDDSQTINVTWKADKMIDSVTIEVLHDDNRVIKLDINDTTILMQGNYKVDAYYGKQIVKVTSYRTYGKYTQSDTQTETVNLTASEYVIAPLTATMPVTLFTLSLKDITNNYTIPTFVWFKRSGVWEYDEMPQNVKLIPVCDTKDFIHDTDQSGVYEKVSKWVKELYELNSDSKFSLYYDDYFPHGWMQATIGNNIPEDNYSVTLLSDGAGSFLYFNDCFDNDNVDTVYQQMKVKYETLKTEVRSTGEYTAYSNKYVIDSEELRKYIYVMIKEEANVEWWLTRISGTMANNNTSLYAELETLVGNGSLKIKDLKTLLDALNNDEQTELKKLFNFSDTMFEKAVEQNKDVMVFLGTWNSDEEYFAEYIKTVQKLYGDKYVYYYKGHPKSPTVTVEGKFSQLESLGVIDIDSTIPAELIFFFNPQVFASGYPTTTFYSIEVDKSMTVVGLRMDELAEGYKSNIKSFVSKVDSTDETYGLLVTSNNCFLVEFTDTTNYNIAIFDASNQSIKYYKYNGTTYIEV